MIVTSCGKGRYGNIREVLKSISPPRKRVLLKPNLVAPGLGAVPGESVKAVLDSMSVDIIVEGSSVDTNRLYRGLGYENLAKEYGVELIDINEEEEWDEVPFLGIHGKALKARIWGHAKRYNVVSLTLPKTHDHAIVTLTLKNMVGFLHPRDRSLVHGYSSSLGRLMGRRPLRIIGGILAKIKLLRRYFSVTDVDEDKYLRGARVIHRNIATLARHVNPVLGIIDGYTGMQGRGPVAGDALPWDMAIAGQPIECDVYCAYKMGFDPEDVGYLHYLRAPSIDSIKIIGGDEIPRKKFTPHPKIRLQMMWRGNVSQPGKGV